MTSCLLIDQLQISLLSVYRESITETRDNPLSETLGLFHFHSHRLLKEVSLTFCSGKVRIESLEVLPTEDAWKLPKTKKESPKLYNMTLNLSDPAGTSPMPHLWVQASDILTSREVGLHELAPHELEWLISNGLITTTPTPTQFIAPKNVTDEQEGFAEGFVHALDEQHHQHMDDPASVTSAQATVNTVLPPVSSYAGASNNTAALHSDCPVYENLNNFNPAISTVSAPNYTTSAPTMHFPAASPQLPIYGQPGLPRFTALKEEPQTVPEMPGETSPLSSIEMELEECIKVEKMRMSNRIRASKYRKRKAERIKGLQDTLKTLMSQNSELASTANMLREEVAQLKQMVTNHVNSGCQLMLTQQLQTF